MKNAKLHMKKLARRSLVYSKRFAHRFDRQKAAAAKLPGYSPLQRAIIRYKLAFGIGGAITLCLLLTGFSVFLYAITGTSKLDLSRPGYENARQKIQPGGREDSFEPDGALDGKIMANYLEKYKKQSRTLKQYDNFDPKLLDDSEVGLTPVQIAPSDGSTPQE